MKEQYKKLWDCMVELDRLQVKPTIRVSKAEYERFKKLTKYFRK